MTQRLLEEVEGSVDTPHQHCWKIARPVRKSNADQSVFGRCTICGDTMWFRLPPNGYARLLKDIADGKFN